MVDAYVNRKHGREEYQSKYDHEVMREVLDETYGVMVYQEQVMRLLNRLGGVELSAAYATIKAISKKKAEVIAKGRDQFVAGAVERGVAADKAKHIFELIEFFGGYGFNKSHSTAYALVAYQTAYLKAHYPTEFMAALLSSEMDGAEREKFFVEHIDDCRRMGLEVLAPNVNEGSISFVPAAEGRIHFGLGAIKGVGYKALESLLKARDEAGAFRSLDDACDRVNPREVTQGTFEILIKAGAFDCLKARRSQLLAVLPRVVQGGLARQEDRRRGQRSLFDSFEGEAAETADPATPLPDIPELADADRLAEEKRVLGFYMTSHPLTPHARTLTAFGTHQVADLGSLPDRAEVLIGGLITNIQMRSVQKSRSGATRMAKFDVEDLSGSIKGMLWPEDFLKFESILKDDMIGFFKGTLSRQRDPAELVVNRVIPLERAAAELSRGVVLTLRKGLHAGETLDQVHRLMSQCSGNLDVFFEVLGLDGFRRVIFRGSPQLRIRHDDRLQRCLEEAVGDGNVRWVGPQGATAVVTPRLQEALVASNDFEADDYGGLDDSDG
jgi:DNA polymerase-3 subunit alpha